MRQGRRSAAAASGGLRHLADLGLREQDEVKRDLLQDPGGQPQRGRQVRDAQPRRVPGKGGLIELEPLREQADHPPALRPKRRQRPGRAAELHRQRQRAEALARIDHRVEPARGLQPEGGGKGLLEQRAAGHHRAAVLVRESRAGRRHPAEVRPDQAERAARDQHRGGVHHVLAGGAAVDEAGGLVVELLPQRGHQRHHRVAAGAAVAGDHLGVEVSGVAGGGDRLRSVSRDHSGLCLRAGQGRLGVQHRLQPGRFGGRPADGFGDEEAAEQRFRRQRRRSRRHPGDGCRSADLPPRGSRRGSSRSSASSIEERTGSSAFASASSGK